MDDFYGTAAAFRTYHEDRSRDVDAYDDDGDVESALLVASEWLDNMMRSSIGGTKVGAAAQIREWPRTGMVDRYGYSVSSESVPLPVEYATYEAALRQLQSAGSLTVDFTPSRYRRVAVDGAVSVEYANVGASDVQTQFPVIWQILDPLIGGRGSVSPLSGLAVRA